MNPIISTSLFLILVNGALAATIEPFASFSANPDKFTLGNQFTAKCSLSGFKQEDVGIYTVAFYFVPRAGDAKGQDIVIGAYAVDRK